jgi:uncharacterized protein (DUF362 family)
MPACESRVALVRGENRYDNVSQALAHLAAGMDFAGKQRILIKPNFVLTNNPLATTHVDAVRAVLGFLRACYDGPITIAEGPALQPAAEGFRRYGYDALARDYGVTLRDLNYDDLLPVQVYDWRLQPLRLHLARSVVESDFRISVGPPKTHDTVIVTLSLKNMIMGALIAPLVVPHLAIIDAFEAMEGNGPTDGTPVPLHLALASSDALAADVAGAALMGFDAAEVGYLHHCAKMGLGCGDLAQIEIVGNASLAECMHKVQPHETYRQQRRWKSPRTEALLNRAISGE